MAYLGKFAMLITSDGGVGAAVRGERKALLVAVLVMLSINLYINCR